MSNCHHLNIRNQCQRCVELKTLENKISFWFNLLATYGIGMVLGVFVWSVMGIYGQFNNYSHLIASITFWFFIGFIISVIRSLHLNYKYETV